MKNLLIVTLAITCLAAAACGGDDSDPDSTLGAITPVGTKVPTEQASDGAATPGSEGPPSPVMPELDEELTLFLDGQIFADIQPGDSYEVDPIALGEQVGTPPSCDNFQFDFSWQVTDPYPPDGVAFKWQLLRDDGPVDIAIAPAGNQAVGCDTLLAVNEGATPISVAVRYLIGGR